MDYGINSLDNYNYVDPLNPLGGSTNKLSSNNDYALAVSGQSQATNGDSCHEGAEIFLKRIVKKLFLQMNKLQPHELDDEFLYESTLSYEDYQQMLKQVQSDKSVMDCASLNRIENILSNLMTSATIRRPTQTSLLSNFLYMDSISGSTPLFGTNFIGGTTSTHLTITLLIVCLLAWIFSHIGLKGWKSWPFSLFIVGFVEIYIHSMNQVKLSYKQNVARCANPTWISYMASLINYDYDNCRSVDHSPQPPNIATTAMDYVSKLLFMPMVHFFDKLGKSFEKYLNSFTGINYFLAPIILVILVVSIPIIVAKYIVAHNQVRNKQRRFRISPQKLMNSPKKQNSNSNQRANAIPN